MAIHDLFICHDSLIDHITKEGLGQASYNINCQGMCDILLCMGIASQGSGALYIINTSNFVSIICCFPIDRTTNNY